MQNLRNGDVLRISNNSLYVHVSRYPLYDHYGIYVKTPSGQDNVIHYTETGENGNFKGTVRETTLEEF